MAGACTEKVTLIDLLVVVAMFGKVLLDRSYGRISVVGRLHVSLRCRIGEYVYMFQRRVVRLIDV